MVSKDYKWYLVYTKNQHERKVSEDTLRWNVVSYLPMIKSVRYWSDRKKSIDVPLFPNYVFLKISCKEYIKVLEHPSVISFIRSGKDLSVISERILNSIKTIVNEKMEYFVDIWNPGLGSLVKVINGPLKGLTGEIIDLCNETYVIIGLTGIGKSIFVKIQKEKLITCNKNN